MSATTITTTMTTSKSTSVTIPDRLYFRIGDVSEILGVKPYVLRYWESEFSSIAPQKSSTGQRVYRKADVETLLLIKSLLYDQRYSIEGAKKRLKELRKLGELATSKKLAVQNLDQGKQDDSHTQELKKLLRDFSELLKQPVSEFFKF